MTLKLAFDIRKVSAGDYRSSSVRIFEPYGIFKGTPSKDWVRVIVGQRTDRSPDRPLGHGPFRSNFYQIYQSTRPKFWQSDKTDTAWGMSPPGVRRFLTSSELIVKVCANSVSVRLYCWSKRVRWHWALWRMFYSRSLVRHLANRQNRLWIKSRFRSCRKVGLYLYQ